MLPFLILLSAAFMLDYIEVKFGNTIPFSGLIAVMAMGIGLQKEYSVPSVRIIITAPLGAALIDLFYRRMLIKD